MVYTDRGSAREIVILLGCSMSDCGVGLDKILFNIGKRIAHCIMEETGYDRKKIRSRLEEVFAIKITDYTSGERLRLGFIADENSPLKVRNMATIFFGTVSMVELRLTNNLYCHSPEVRGSDNRFVMETYRTGSPVDPSDYEITNNKLELKGRFAVYTTKGLQSYIVTNTVMLNLLDRLSDSPKTVNELSAEMNIRTVTIHASVKKMVSIGFIQPNEEGTSRNMKYKLVAKKILNADPKLSNYFLGNPDEYIHEFLRGVWGLFDVLFNSVAHINSVGIKFDSVNEEVANIIVGKIMEERPDITAGEFLRLAPNLLSSPRMKFKLVSTLPIEFTYTKNDAENQNLETYSRYLRKLVDTGMKAITGYTYPIHMRQEDSD